MSLRIRLRRAGYRFAYTLLRVYWFVARPRSHGVKCVLTNRGRVLLVRHTYGPRAWELPGGAVKRHELPLDAARREIEEELGISIADVTPLGTISGRLDNRRDTVHCFQAQAGGLALEIDRGEIETAEWFKPDELPPDLGRYVRPILARLRG